MIYLYEGSHTRENKIKEGIEGGGGGGGFWEAYTD
jgi:hypothetical protein